MRGHPNEQTPTTRPNRPAETYGIDPAVPVEQLRGRIFDLEAQLAAARATIKGLRAALHSELTR